MDGVSDSAPSAPVDSAPVDSAPVDSGTSTPAADAPAASTDAPKVDNPDVQATTEGKSDYQPPPTPAPVDLNGGAATVGSRFRVAPGGVTASGTVTNTLD